MYSVPFKVSHVALARRSFAVAGERLSLFMYGYNKPILTGNGGAIRYINEGTGKFLYVEESKGEKAIVKLLDEYGKTLEVLGTVELEGEVISLGMMYDGSAIICDRSSCKAVRDGQSFTVTRSDDILWAAMDSKRLYLSVHHEDTIKGFIIEFFDSEIAVHESSDLAELDKFDACNGLVLGDADEPIAISEGVLSRLKLLEYSNGALREVDEIPVSGSIVRSISFAPNCNAFIITNEWLYYYDGIDVDDIAANVGGEIEAIHVGPNDVALDYGFSGDYSVAGSEEGRHYLQVIPISKLI